MKSFLDALERARDIDSARAEAVSHGNIGLLHQYEGRYPAALAAYEEPLGILQTLDDKRGLAEFTIKASGALLELGRTDEAERRLGAADAWVRAIGNREQGADYDTLRGELRLAKGDGAAARRAFADAVDRAAASGSPAAILRAQVARGAALVVLGDAAGAAPDLAAASRKADALGDALLRIRAGEALARAARPRPGACRRCRPARTRSRRALRLGGRPMRLYAPQEDSREGGRPRGAAAARRERTARRAAARSTERGATLLLRRPRRGARGAGTDGGASLARGAVSGYGYPSCGYEQIVN
jgi:hypothetical protein